MRIDLLKTQSIDRAVSGNVQYQAIRGRFSDLLLINETTWHYKDVITIVLRHEGGKTTIVDRVSALVLATLCDLKRGMTTTGSPDYPGDANGDNNDNNGYVRVNQGVRFYENAFLLPLGHITLTGSQVLEITIETASMPRQANPAGGTFDQPKGLVKISTVQYKARVDTLITYDMSRDLEAQQAGIREVYLVGRNNVSMFINSTDTTYGVPLPMDIQVKIAVDGEDSENSLDSYSAMTAITGQLSAMPSNLIRVFQDLESLPASVYVKVYGEDAAAAELLYLRETSIPHLSGASISTALESETKRVEQLEQNDPARAKQLVQAGVIAPSDTLKKLADNFVPAVQAPTK